MPGKRMKSEKRILLILSICILSICILSFWFGSRSSASPLVSGFVTEVFDGDTIKVSLQGGRVETVRYIGMDTPETHHPNRGVEELGKEAWKANSELVLEKRVRLELDVEERDRYGRLLAYVWLDRGKNKTMVNVILVRKGYAMPFTFPPNLRYTDLFRKAFMDAREAGEGLWKRASSRGFSPAQVWAELPSLAGSFITLSIMVDNISESNRRFSLHPREGNTALIIYKSDSSLFGPIEGLKGKTLNVVGKVVAGFNGAEVALADPAQIISVE
ncbi:MAG: thermonuclease family protein [Thermovirgaceae bacterium]|nr:thermonuclease family protein [Thermovirgaceae bacterium]